MVLLAVQSVWTLWADLLAGHSRHSRLTLALLEIVSIMLEANVTVAQGVKTLNDLEERVVSVVIAILAINFLEHFIAWEKPPATLEFGAALAVVGALVAFQAFSHRATEDQKAHHSDLQARAQRDLFQGDNEQHALGLGAADAPPQTPAAD